MLGAGWYKGLMGICKRRNNYGKQTAFLMQMVVRYEDGSSQLVISDPSWRGADSPIVFSEIYDGEIRDDRLMKDDRVYGAAFADGSRPVETVAYPMNALEAQGNCRVQEIEEVPVKQVITTPKGETVLDFGQNIAGYVSFHIHALPVRPGGFVAGGQRTFSGNGDSVHAPFQNGTDPGFHLLKKGFGAA